MTTEALKARSAQKQAENDASAKAAQYGAQSTQAIEATKQALINKDIADSAAARADNAKAKAGMSMGTKVGIGLGAVAVVGLVVFLLLRKKG
jgi:hypothetical protein